MMCLIHSMCNIAHNLLILTSIVLNIHIPFLHTEPSGSETIIQAVTGSKEDGSGNIFTFGLTKQR